VTRLFAILDVQLPFYEDNTFIRTIDLKGEATAKSIELSDHFVPDVRGMSARDALYLLDLYGIRASIDGFGWVAEQSVNPGSPVGGVESMKLKMTSNQ
jgi:hypothetical protein